MFKFLAGLLGFGLVKSGKKVSDGVVDYQSKSKTITNAVLQEKTNIAYNNIYLQKLSTVDSEIETFPTEDKKSLFDILEELYENAGIEFDLKREEITVEKCFKNYWRKHGYSFSQKDYAAILEGTKDKTLYERLTSTTSPYAGKLNALIYQEVKRSMWKKGYNMSYGGKESKWQEEIKAKQKSKSKEINSPWA